LLERYPESFHGSCPKNRSDEPEPLQQARPRAQQKSG
jgi:hypothetical protein